MAIKDVMKWTNEWFDKQNTAQSGRKGDARQYTGPTSLELEEGGC